MRTPRCSIPLVSCLVLAFGCDSGEQSPASPGDPSPASTEKAITAYAFASPAATGTIDENAKAIVVTVPFGTNVKALVATFTTTGASVKVGTTEQLSGTTVNDFSSPVDYVVTAADGTAATYAVSVAIDRATELYLVNENDDSVITLGADASGTPDATRRFTNPSNRLEAVHCVAVDPVHDEIVAGDWTTGRVQIFGRTADGGVVPARTIDNGGQHGVVAVSFDAANDEIFVVNAEQGSIRVYDRLAAHDAAPKRTIQGLNTRLSAPYGLAVDHDEIVVTSFTSNTLSVWARTADGDVAPNRTTTEGLNRPIGVAIDTTTGDVFVANYDGNDVTVYSSALVLQRTLSGPSTGLHSPRGIAVDAVDAELFVTNEGSTSKPDSITVYGQTDSGDHQPTRTISGPGTGLDEVFGVALDMTDGELVVPNFGNQSITVYGRMDDGDTVPLRTITNAPLGLSCPVGIAVDRTADHLVVANACSASIATFDRTATGEVLPVQLVAGSSTGLGCPGGIAVDALHGEVFAADPCDDAILVFRVTDTGDVAPLRKIAGAVTALAGPAAVAVDTAADEIFVANANDGTIRVFGRSDDGDKPWRRTIEVGTSGSSYPGGVALDPVHDEVLVADNGSQAVYAFARTADYDTSTPARTITGSNTTLAWPVGLAVDARSDEIFVVGPDGRVLVFDRTLGGDVAPTRLIASPAAKYPQQIALW